MELLPLSIDGAFEIIPKSFVDDRGSFTTTYDETIFAKAGLSTRWVADNQSFNHHRGTLRGLHFQRYPSAQSKFVRALTGAVFDVFVDLRPDSPTFLRCATVELNDKRNNGVYIPKGCAHGYLTLEDRSIVSYKVDALYDPKSEGGFAWNEQAFGIIWPDGENLIISAKDMNWPEFDPSQNPFAERKG